MVKTTSILASVLAWAVLASAARAGESPTAASESPRKASAAKRETHPIFESPAIPRPKNQLDRIVFARLEALDIQPVLCSDAVFLRRAYLDLLGVLPTAEEARAFLRDDNKNKRRALVDQLLERDEYAVYWAMKWGDILRIKAEFPVNLWPNAAQAYHHWVKASLAENKPYDRFVREMLTASGSNFRVGQVNFYRAVQNKTPEGIAGAVALTFMGARTDAWPKERVEGMAAFFSQIGYKPTSEWKEEHVFWDPLQTRGASGIFAPGRAALPAVPEPKKPAAKGAPQQPAPQPAPPPAATALVAPAPRKAMFPDGKIVELPPDRDPREVFADWLIAPDNPWFARCIANRVWHWLLGRGIVHEPDDFRDDNPPSCPELLDYLAKELVANHYDLKRYFRLVLNSQAYQFSSMPRFNSPEAEKSFAAYVPRRLEAEVLIDAINRITGTTDLYTSPIPEPFTYIPKDMPAVALADGSITSSVLTLFGRSARATGMESERDNKSVPAQWLHLLNSSHVQLKLERGPALKAIVESRRKTEEIAEELYLTVLSRFPTPDEVKIIEEYGESGAASQGDPTKKSAKPPAAKKRNEWLDIAWALLNSDEFLFRH